MVFFSVLIWPTRVTKTSVTAIDYMLTNAILEFERKIGTIKNGLSVHFGDQFQKGQVSMTTFLNKM